MKNLTNNQSRWQSREIDEQNISIQNYQVDDNNPSKSDQSDSLCSTDLIHCANHSIASSTVAMWLISNTGCK